MTNTKKRQIDMINGPIVKSIILFTVPLMLSGILQLFYSASDMIVAGRFGEAGSLGAIGSTMSVINLIVNAFISLSVGSTVAVARYFGAGDKKGISRAVHTSVLISFICGVVIAAAGYFASHSMLVATGTPEDIIARSTIYMQIYFLGSPFNLVYNFGSAVLRAVGDTRRPLYYLAVAATVNIGLNIFFVTVFNWGVAGVAIATVISQIISAVLVVICLVRDKGATKLEFKKLRIHKRELLMIAKIGIPASLQSILFSFSSVLIQSSVNSFGSAVVEGDATAGRLDSVIYTSMNAVSQASLTFISQNNGARNYGRINKILRGCTLVVFGVAAILGSLIYGFREPLTGIFLSNPGKVTVDTIQLRLFVWCATYFGCGLMEVLACAIRGLNYSVLPMIVTLIGACLLRIVWIYTVFRMYRSMFCLYISYPITWVITIAAHYICYRIIMRKLKRTQPQYFEPIEKRLKRSEAE